MLVNQPQKWTLNGVIGKGWFATLNCVTLLISNPKWRNEPKSYPKWRIGQNLTLNGVLTNILYKRCNKTRHHRCHWQHHQHHHHHLIIANILASSSSPPSSPTSSSSPLISPIHHHHHWYHNHHRQHHCHHRHHRQHHCHHRHHPHHHHITAMTANIIIIIYHHHKRHFRWIQ